MQKNNIRAQGSFRDPSGFVFEESGILYRQINRCYASQYAHLMESGLYAALTDEMMLIPHTRSSRQALDETGALVIEPQRVPFVSYPYEWCFGQLKDAALLTLRTHLRALDFGMVLKDASAYNVQFLAGRAIFIDTLSFDFYEDGAPWLAYGQFCRHFLAPLLLMSLTDSRLAQLLRVYIDGIPLDLATRLLGGKGGFFATQHIRWHARSLKQYKEDVAQSHPPQTRITRFAHEALIKSLIRGIEKLECKGLSTEWGDYGAQTSYSQSGAASKQAIVTEYLRRLHADTLWDLGANDGTYSRIALQREGAHVVAFDADATAVERNYQQAKRAQERMLPLMLDLANPSPGIGFANRERMPLCERQRPGCILCLALIHHLAIANNVPLPMLAAWLASLSSHLIIEFVPKEDVQVQKMLKTRVDIFSSYTLAAFEAAFGIYFDLLDAQPVQDSLRTLYLFQAKEQ